MAYDIEGLLTNIETILKANLNTKITAINSEKNDSIVLDSVLDASYQYDMDDKEANYNPFMLIYPIPEDSEGIGPCTSETIIINVNLIHTDSGNDINILLRLKIGDK
jgi:hypothetical protein